MLLLLESALPVLNRVASCWGTARASLLLFLLLNFLAMLPLLLPGLLPPSGSPSLSISMVLFFLTFSTAVKNSPRVVCSRRAPIGPPVPLLVPLFVLCLLSVLFMEFRRFILCCSDLRLVGAVISLVEPKPPTV